MQGWKIFTYSLEMVFGNLRAAFRISLVLYLAQAAFGIYFTNGYGDFMREMAGGNVTSFPPGFWLSWTLFIAVSFVTSLWIAVGWHRYILIEENNGAIIPPFQGAQMLAYLGKSLLIGLLLGFAFILVSSFLSLVMGAVAGVTGVLISTFISFGLMFYLFYRLGLILPAAAVGGAMTFSESWETTAPASTAVGQLAVIAIGFVILTRIPQYMNYDPDSIINIVYTYVLGWITMTVGASALTTLYGVYFEGRKI